MNSMKNMDTKNNKDTFAKSADVFIFLNFPLV